MPTLELMDKGVVAYRPDQLYGWPGLAKISDTELIAISSERKIHIDPFGRVVIHRSHDGGKTWELPQEIYNSELDDRDGTIIAKPDGTLIAAWFTSDAFAQYALQAEPGTPGARYRRRAERITDRMREELIGSWLIRSYDNGRTWEEEPTRLPMGGAEHCTPTLLSNGDLATFGYINDGGSERMCFFTSSDNGDNWVRVSQLDAPMRPHNKPHLDVGEPIHEVPEINERSLLEITPEHLLVVFRCHPHERATDPIGADENPSEDKKFKYAHLVQFESTDAGKTWSPPRRLPVYGFPPQLLKLHDGTIMCSYSDRRNPKRIRAMFSTDNGKTWDLDQTHVMEEWPEASFDMGYPLTVELAPYELFTIYYRHFWLGHEKHFDPSQRMGLLSLRHRLQV